MIAAIVNAIVVVLGGILGLLLGGRLKEKHTKTIVAALGICTAVIGITSAIVTTNILIVIICLVVGTIIGELLKIEHRLDTLGDWLKSKVAKNGGGRFTEGFVTASLLFCVGSMAIMGSFDAGLRGDYNTIFAKSALDCVMAVTFAATMGVGVLFSGATVLIYQGALTLLAGFVEPYLSPEVIVEMSAVGGVMLIGTGINILGLTKERVKVGNMLPAIMLPVLWFAVANLVK
ncbi:MAG: DUF554 domain-containing protein [Oscillospiraceae bacterium]|nr:DUF554 domain-containing protein [Oscillospiraceae bacterium]